MKAVIFKVGEKPIVDNIPDDLKSQQDFVGGYIEAINIGDGLIVICNEDGKMLNLQENRPIRSETGAVIAVLRGNFFVCRQEKMEMGDIKDEDVQKILDIFAM